MANDPVKNDAATAPGDDLAEIMASPLDHLADPDPVIRRLAVSLAAGRVAEPVVAGRLIALLAADPDGAVRAEATEVLGGFPEPATAEALLTVLDDDDVRVVEAAATALGETPPDPATVARLVELATDPEADRMVREAAVASLGALGDPTVVPVLIALLEGAPPQVRRRAVVALTVFDDPAIEPALRAATADRNPMVREVAELVVGRNPT